MDRRLLDGISGFGVLMLTVAQMAVADTQSSQGGGQGVQLQPQAIQVGGMALLPVLESSTVYDNNTYRLNQGAIGSWYQVVNPTVHLMAQDRLNVYDVMYSLKGASYSNSSDDSYLDQILGGMAHIEPNGRMKLDGLLKYSMLHDDRGTGFTSGMSADAIYKYGAVDKYDTLSIGGGMQYGADDALGNLVLKAAYEQRRYSRTVVADARDKNDLNTLLGLYIRLAPKTRATFDYERTNSDYTGKSPDFTDNRFLFGVAWQDTVQTQGRAQFGFDRRSISGKSTLSTPSWLLGVVWAPYARDAVNFDSSQRWIDSDQVGGSDDKLQVGVTWRHIWLARLNTTIGGEVTRDKYYDSNKVVYRNDDTKALNLGGEYQMRRWLVLNTKLSTVDRTSDQSNFKFSRHVFSIGVQMGL